MFNKAVTFVVTIQLGWPPKVGHPRLLADLSIISGDGDSLLIINGSVPLTIVFISYLHPPLYHSAVALAHPRQLMTVSLRDNYPVYLVQLNKVYRQFHHYHYRSLDNHSNNYQYGHYQNLGNLRWICHREIRS